MKKLVLFCFLASLVFSCGSKKAVATKRPSHKTKTERVFTKEVSKKTSRIDESASEVVNGAEVNITSTEEYIALFKTIAQEEMRFYGIPASITLAQGILESNSGKGRLSVEANNHFGIKCHDWTGEKIYHDDDASQECFRKYNDSKYSYRDHSLFLSQRSRYAALFKLKKEDYKGWAKELRRAGYATDKKYPDKLIDLIERYNLNQYDAEVLGDAYQKYDEPRMNTVISRNRNSNSNTSTHSVGKGDTMYSISKAYNLSVKELQELNGLSTTDLSLGQELNVNKDGVTLANSNQINTAKTSVENRLYIVGKGDTLYSISKKYNMTVAELKQLNRLTDAALNIGQELQVKSTAIN